MLVPVQISTVEQFYEQRKSRLDPINIMLSQKRFSAQPKSPVRVSKVLSKPVKEPIVISKMNSDEKIEGDELFDYNRKDGWNFILNNIILPAGEKSRHNLVYF